MYRINLSLVLATKRIVTKALLGVAVLSATTATATTQTDVVTSDNIVMAAEDNTIGFTGLEDVVGKTISEVKANAVKAGNYPTDDMNKIFFLYNVQTGLFINAGGFWGTHISLKDYPMLLWVNTNSKYGDQTIELAQNMDTGEGKLLGWMSNEDPADNGVFIDRNINDKTHYGWTFEPLNDAKNTYRIYTYTTNSPLSSSPKFYLCANKGNVDQDKNCGAFSEQKISSEDLSGYDTWRIMSMQQIYDLQKLNSDDMTSPLDMSFQLKCPGFSRGDKNITNWKTSIFGGKSDVRYGLERVYNTTEKVASDKYDVEDISDSNPYTFDGKTYKDKNPQIRNYHPIHD